MDKQFRLSNTELEKELDLAFEWFVPISRNDTFMVSIPNDKCINLNPKFYNQISSRITIGLSSKGQKICIKECSENGYKIPKSGSIKDVGLIKMLKERGIKLPANYSIHLNNGLWFGDLIVPSNTTSSNMKIPKNPRDKGLNSMIP